MKYKQGIKKYIRYQREEFKEYINSGTVRGRIQINVLLSALLDLNI